MIFQFIEWMTCDSAHRLHIDLDRTVWVQQMVGPILIPQRLHCRRWDAEMKYRGLGLANEFPFYTIEAILNQKWDVIYLSWTGEKNIITLRLRCHSFNGSFNSIVVDFIRFTHFYYLLIVFMFRSLITPFPRSLAAAVGTRFNSPRSGVFTCLQSSSRRRRVILSFLKLFKWQIATVRCSTARRILSNLRTQNG